MDQKLASLRAAIDRATPVCQGTLLVAKDALTLFYGNDADARRLNLANASLTELQQLSDACAAATFGLDQQDVLDESYRRARKMNASDFAVKLERAVADILADVVHPVLVQDEKRSITAKLYKLNVYGQGSFFKPHKDTPRAAEMFASLVIAFPVTHTGGELVLRHEGEERTFDSGKLLVEAGAAQKLTSEASEGLTSEASGAPIAFVAFHSDIEHEVLPVKSGHRVTVTYNLYHKLAPATYTRNSKQEEVPSNESAFEHTLQSLLADETFLPDGGYLGFGLRHMYPFDKKEAPSASLLKGADAMVHRVCTRLHLHSSVQILYEHSGQTVLMPKPADFGHGEVDDEDFHPMFTGQGVVVDSSWGGGEKVFWVNEAAVQNKAETPLINYGNETCLMYVYGEFNLVVRVGPSGERCSS